MKHAVNIEIDTDSLSGYSDDYIATLWHIAQANPVEYGDRNAGDLVELVGREIIKRFLKAAPVALYNIQGRDHFWKNLTDHCQFINDAWVLKAQEVNVPAAMNDDEHFVTVPARTLENGRHVAAFKYAKYPSSKGADGQMVLSPSLKPWVNINQSAASEACAAAGFELARESQEIAIRLDVCELDINWTGGKVGVGKVFQGLHKGTVSGPPAADFVSDDPEERSWHQLSTGERVYGLAGNIYTHVHDDIQGDSRGVVQSAFAANSPSITAAPYPSCEKGMGYRPSAEADLSGRALVRGGYWVDGDNAGVFYLGDVHPAGAFDYVGFRCTKPV